MMCLRFMTWSSSCSCDVHLSTRSQRWLVPSRLNALLCFAFRCGAAPARPLVSDLWGAEGGVGFRSSRLQPPRALRRGRGRPVFAGGAAGWWGQSWSGASVRTNRASRSLHWFTDSLTRAVYALTDLRVAPHAVRVFVLLSRVWPSSLKPLMWPVTCRIITPSHPPLAALMFRTPSSQIRVNLSHLSGTGVNQHKIRAIIFYLKTMKPGVRRFALWRCFNAVLSLNLIPVMNKSC